VNADPLGHQGAKQQSEKDDRHHLSGLIRRFDPRRESPGQRPQDGQHEADKDNSAGDDPQRTAEFRLSDAYDQGEQAPGDHIVDGRTRQSQRTQRRRLHAAIVQNAGQHRERGYRQSHADEQSERHDGDIGRRQL